MFVRTNIIERRAAVASHLWKVGELAKRSGVSVRTLHWYEEVGLIAPSQRTEAGHRLYAAEDVQRLQQIMSLRQLGFALDEIRECLGRPEFTPRHVIELHVARLDQQIEAQQRLRARLDLMAKRFEAAEEVSAEQFIEAIEEMTMMEKYFTTEQLDALKQRGDSLGPEAIKKVENEWPELIAKVRAELDKGTDPAAPHVQALAKRWMELVSAFSGGDRAIEKSVTTMYRNEPQVGQ